jgi:Arc/MetJ-type ribon-helix-helix transcriptional regulator
MKRTTLVLEESCVEGVRDLARRAGKNMSDVVNELLAEGLQRRKARRRRDFNLPSFAMGRPRVNLGDRNALEALMDS